MLHHDSATGLLRSPEAWVGNFAEDSGQVRKTFPGWFGLWIFLCSLAHFAAQAFWKRRFNIFPETFVRRHLHVFWPDLIFQFLTIWESMLQLPQKVTNHFLPVSIRGYVKVGQFFETHSGICKNRRRIHCWMHRKSRYGCRCLKANIRLSREGQRVRCKIHRFCPVVNLFFANG